MTRIVGTKVRERLLCWIKRMSKDHKTETHSPFIFELSSVDRSWKLTVLVVSILEMKIRRN